MGTSKHYEHENVIDQMKKKWNSERKMYDQTIKLLKIQKNERLLDLNLKDKEINDLRKQLKRNQNVITLMKEHTQKEFNALTMRKDEISDSDENDESYLAI